MSYSCINPPVLKQYPQVALPIGPFALPDANPVVLLVTRLQGGNMAIIMSAANIQIDACCDPIDTISNSLAWDSGLWATNINPSNLQFYTLSAHVTALRFTNNTGLAAQISVNL